MSERGWIWFLITMAWLSIISVGIATSMNSRARVALEQAEPVPFPEVCACRWRDWEESTP